jgi:hypothetical protein
MGGESKAISGTHPANLSFSRLLSSTSIIASFGVVEVGSSGPTKKAMIFWVGGQCLRSLDRQPTGKLGFSWIRGISGRFEAELY